MSRALKLNILLNSKIIVGLTAAVLLVLGLVLVAQGFMDTRNYRDQIITIIHEQTGKNATIRGKVTISLLPTPTIFIPGIELRDNEDATKPGPAMSVEMIRLNVTVGSVFTSHPRVSAVALMHPTLELTRADDHIIHWDWLNGNLIKALAGNRTSDAPLSVMVDDGTIIYRDSSKETATTLSDISISASSGSRLSASGGFTLYDHVLKFTADTAPGKDAAPLATGAVPLNFKLYTDAKNTLQLNGSMNMAGETPKIQGKVSLELENILNWIGRQKKPEAQELFAQITHTSSKVEEEQVKLPVKFSGDWSQDGLNVDIAGARLDGMRSLGTGTITLGWVDSQPNITSVMAFSALNYDDWRTLFLQASAKNNVDDTNPYAPGAGQNVNPLPQNVKINLTLTSDMFSVGQQSWQKAKLSVALSNAVLTVNQFDIELPGEASLALFGIISQAGTGGMRFEGSMETQGKSLRQLLTVFDESAIGLPETGFGAFYARSNIFVSSQQMRLSEADVKISDLHLNGGLVAYYDEHPRLEADVKLRDINFDYFRDVWREKEKAVGHRDFFLQFDKSMSFNWLKNLQTTIDLKVSVEGFTFLDRKGDNASFRLFVKENEFGIYDIRFNYPDGFTEGGIKLDVKGDQPHIDVTLNTDEVNTNYFSVDMASDARVQPVVLQEDKDTIKSDGPDGTTLEVTPEAQTIQLAQDSPAAPLTPPAPATGIEDLTAAAAKKDAPVPGKKVWSEELIDMGWMEGFSGNFDISIGKLTAGKYLVDRLKLQAKLEHNLLTFQSLSFVYWQARCSVLGSMYGGKVPGISVSYTLYNAELQDILKSLAGRDNINGKVNINGTLTTSGVNYKSWVEQSDAKLILTGRGTHVEGVNMQAAVDAVNASRTAADVFNNVNLALVRGSTDFDVDGTINVHNGVMRTPGITLKTGTIIGDFIGEVRLVPWTMDLSTVFQFPAMTSETVPTMTVQLAGPIEAPELRTDTSPLEAYVAKRITGK